ncbi:MAG TPA: glycoside hydrolase domain-containing protein [Prolixibacteraceae bacterium]|nr:glycoside hydrolase domain-containing protein [Prolixibacteraceae bacterium]
MLLLYAFIDGFIRNGWWLLENPFYDLGSPIFDKVVIHLNPKYYSRGTFTNVIKNNSRSNIYAQNAKLNGKPFNRLKLPHLEIIKG